MSSFFDTPSWPGVNRQQPWDTSRAPQLAGFPPSKPLSIPFYHQLEEVERSIDNLKSTSKAYPIPARRDSVPITHRRGFAADIATVPLRPYSVTDFDVTSSAGPSNLLSEQMFLPHRPSISHNDGDTHPRRQGSHRDVALRTFHDGAYSRNKYP